MARASGSGRELSGRTVVIWLGVFLALALFLRVGFSMDASFDDDAGRYLYSGNDPYYHDRTVTHMVETGESLTFDPAINYPNGAYNPNPPLFDWTTALDAGLLSTMGSEDAVGLALNLSVAFWGALTVIPIYLLGADLFNRRAGLWGAFFMAVSAPHIQRSVFGFADHDATTMFFIALAFVFLVKALKSLDNRTHVRKWNDANLRMEGIKASLAANKVALLWAALAGTALSATALTWKGYPYALGVMAFALGIQLLLDHQRHKDSVSLFAVYLIPVFMVTLIPLPWYATVGFLDNTILAGIYVLVGMIIAGAILIPTRDLPSVVVFPALAGAALLSLLVMLLLVPTIGQTIFTGLGYFEQTKLYSTIAEAQRTEIGFVVANMGFFSFFLGLWGLFRAMKLGWKGDQAMLLMASWGIVAIFMALAASRFVFNAAPVFAILAGGMTMVVLGAMGLDEVRQRYRRRYGQGNVVSNGILSMTWKATTGVFLVAVLLVIPNAWFGVDAATPREYEAENDLDAKRWGAFGLSFDVANNGWLDTFEYLATLDTDVPLEDRPGFMAWWDYGHWATNIGQHPTVADPFQHHYNIAGRVLASESEEEAIAWMAILLVNSDYNENGGKNSQAVRDVLQAVDGGLLGIGPANNDDAYVLVEPHLDNVAELYDDLADATGDHIGYLGVDVRMYPFSADNSGIFYAPAYLANKNPDDFVSVTFSGGVNLEMRQYYRDADGNSQRYEQPRFFNTLDGKEWELIGAEAFPKGKSLTTTGAPISSNQLVVSQAFHDSFFARTFGAQPNPQAPGFELLPDGSAPADGLNHWRAIYEAREASNELRSVVLLQYYTGYEVSGFVRDDVGSPIAGVEVSFVDGFGASHGSALTGENGGFTALAPFSQDGDLELVVRTAGQELHSETFDVTMEQADGGSRSGVEITIPRVDLSGMAFRDLDADGAYNATIDEALSGVTMTLEDRTVVTDGAGRYTFNDLQAGTYTLGGNKTYFHNATATVVVAGTDLVTRDLALRAVAVPATLTFTDGGEPVSLVSIQLEGPTATSVTTNATGVASLPLEPGSYTATIDTTVDKDGQEVAYRAERQFTVLFGQSSFELALVNQA